MSEFEDRLNEVLSNPEQLSRIAGMAQSLMQGGMPEPATGAKPTDTDAAMMGKLGSVLNGAEPKQSRDRRLLEAMRPYLSDKRRGKMDRALRIAKLASIASIAAELGGDDDGNV